MTSVLDVDEYEKKCILIKKLIKSTYTNSKISFVQLNKNDLMFVMFDNIIKIAIIPNANWIDIKLDIDTKFKQTLGDKMCQDCKGIIKCLASCNNCHYNTCLECYIDNFTAGKGIVKCKHCSYSFGHKIPNKYIDLAIDDIRSGAKIK